LIDKLLVSVVAGVLTVILVMQLWLGSLPLFRRLEFDAICHRCTMQMDHDGGLNAVSWSGLTQRLAERGFVVIRISGTTYAKFGDELSLIVESYYPGRQFRQSFSLEEVKIFLTYQSSTICRKMKSYAGEP
jgi:hypothetical protein